MPLPSCRMIFRNWAAADAMRTHTKFFACTARSTASSPVHASTRLAEHVTPQHTSLLHIATTHSPHNLAVVVLDAGSRGLRAQLLDALRLGSSEAHHSLAEGDAQIIPWPIASMEVADARAA